MTPDSDDPTRREDAQSRAAGDGAGPGFDEERLFLVIRDAVKDALLDVLGTLLLLGVAFVLVVSGGQALLWSTSTMMAVGGAVVLAVGLYLAAATLELVPSVSDWF